MMNIGNEIVCPSGRPGSKSIIIDLKQIAIAESRLQEVQLFTKEKAPELLSAYTLAWKDLHQNIVLLTKELNDARRDEEKVRGRLILDEIPRKLKEKDLISSRAPAGSADLRDAMLTQMPEYEAAQEKVAYIEAVVELLKGKLIAFDMAYTSVKKLIGESSSPMYNKPELGTRYTR